MSQITNKITFSGESAAVYTLVQPASRTMFSENAQGMPSKYSKLACFGVWLIMKSGISPDCLDIYMNKLKLFEPVCDQMQLYDTFNAEEKKISKAIRRLVVEKHQENKRKLDERLIVLKENTQKTRDALLRDTFIDNIMEKFTLGRANYFLL